MPEIDLNRLAKSSKQPHSRASSKSHFVNILTGLITPIIPGSIAPIRDRVPLRLVNVLGQNPMIADGSGFECASKLGRPRSTPLHQGTERAPRRHGVDACASL
jgi:hypothetical protein